jgi:hypothetical protein
MYIGIGICTDKGEVRNSILCFSRAFFKEKQNSRFFKALETPVLKPGIPGTLCYNINDTASLCQLQSTAKLFSDVHSYRLPSI